MSKKEDLDCRLYGYVNLRNTCFMNALLQGWSGSDEIMQWLTNICRDLLALEQLQALTMKHYENIVLHSSPLHDSDVDKVEHSVCKNVLLELLVAHENTQDVSDLLRSVFHLSPIRLRYSLDLIRTLLLLLRPHQPQRIQRMAYKSGVKTRSNMNVSLDCEGIEFFLRFCATQDRLLLSTLARCHSSVAIMVPKSQVANNNESPLDIASVLSPVQLLLSAGSLHAMLALAEMYSQHIYPDHQAYNANASEWREELEVCARMQQNEDGGADGQAVDEVWRHWLERHHEVNVSSNPGANPLFNFEQQDAHELQQTLCAWFETLATLLDETRVRMQHCLTPVALTFDSEIPSLPMLDSKTNSCLSMGDVPISQSVDQKCFINLSFVSVLLLAHQPLPQSGESLIELARLYRNCNRESLDEIRTLYQIQSQMALAGFLLPTDSDFDLRSVPEILLYSRCSSAVESLARRNPFEHLSLQFNRCSKCQTRSLLRVSRSTIVSLVVPARTMSAISVLDCLKFDERPELVDQVACLQCQALSLEENLLLESDSISASFEWQKWWLRENIQAINHQWTDQLYSTADLSALTPCALLPYVRRVRTHGKKRTLTVAPSMFQFAIERLQEASSVRAPAHRFKHWLTHPQALCLLMNRSTMQGKTQSYVGYPLKLSLDKLQPTTCELLSDPAHRYNSRDSANKMSGESTVVQESTSPSRTSSSKNVQYVSFASLQRVVTAAVKSTATTSDAISSGQYRLQCVVEHLGSSGQGHYIAFRRHTGNSQWYRISDTSVLAVTEHEVLSRQAYMLFYGR